MVEDFLFPRIPSPPKARRTPRPKARRTSSALISTAIVRTRALILYRRTYRGRYGHLRSRMVLDALLKIKRRNGSDADVAPVLPRYGICGSCSMNSDDGGNTLACLKPIDECNGTVKVSPAGRICL